MYWLRWHYHVKDIAGAPYKIKNKSKQKRQNRQQSVVAGRQQLYCHDRLINGLTTIICIGELVGFIFNERHLKFRWYFLQFLHKCVFPWFRGSMRRSVRQNGPMYFKPHTSKLVNKWTVATGQRKIKCPLNRRDQRGVVYVMGPHRDTNKIAMGPDEWSMIKVKVAKMPKSFYGGYSATYSSIYFITDRLAASNVPIPETGVLLYLAMQIFLFSTNQSINQSINQKRNRVTKITNVTARPLLQ